LFDSDPIVAFYLLLVTSFVHLLSSRIKIKKGSLIAINNGV